MHDEGPSPSWGRVDNGGMAEVQKYGTVIPVSETVIRDIESLESWFKRWQDATPERRAEWEREAADRRRAIREERQAALATPDAVLAGIGRHFDWSPEYVRHLAQPYCECEWDNDGAWNYCVHAYDLGLNR